jgi:small subunit ribosomal protein S1
VGDGIEGLVHISEMAVHHVEAPEQVVTPGEELWVKIIDIDLDRRRISLSIKQAAEGGVVAAEYQDQFGEHMYDEAGNYIGPEIEAPAAPEAPPVAPPETPVHSVGGDAEEPSLLPIEGLLAADAAPEAPAPEAPAPEAPAPEVPAAEVPQTEAPAAEAPAADEPPTEG